MGFTLIQINVGTWYITYVSIMQRDQGFLQFYQQQIICTCTKYITFL